MSIQQSDLSRVLSIKNKKKVSRKVENLIVGRRRSNDLLIESNSWSLLQNLTRSTTARHSVIQRIRQHGADINLVWLPDHLERKFVKDSSPKYKLLRARTPKKGRQSCSKRQCVKQTHIQKMAQGSIQETLMRLWWRASFPQFTVRRPIWKGAILNAVLISLSPGRQQRAFKRLAWGG